MTEIWFRFQELKPKKVVTVVQYHNGWLVLENFVKKVFETNLNDKYQQEKKSEKLTTLSTFKIDMFVPYFFLIFYLLVPKIKVCLR